MDNQVSNADLLDALMLAVVPLETLYNTCRDVKQISPALHESIKDAVLRIREIVRNRAKDA